MRRYGTEYFRATLKNEYSKKTVNKPLAFPSLRITTLSFGGVLRLVCARFAEKYPAKQLLEMYL